MYKTNMNDVIFLIGICIVIGCLISLVERKISIACCDRSKP